MDAQIIVCTKLETFHMKSHIIALLRHGFQLPFLALRNEPLNLGCRFVSELDTSTGREFIRAVAKPTKISHVLVSDTVSPTQNVRFLIVGSHKSNKRPHLQVLVDLVVVP